MTPPSGDVIVAHDYLTQRGGAERVALVLAGQLGAKRIVTAAYRADQTFPEASAFRIEQIPSLLLRPFARDPRKALPFLASAWSSSTPLEAEAVVCSSSGWAHGVLTTADTKKVVYCHNPARWLYQRRDYTADVAAPVRWALTALAPSLRRWDRRAARTATVYIANSTSVRDRIRSAYGIDAEVVHPPVSIDPSGAAEALPGVEPGFFLSVARARGYKGASTLVEAFGRMPEHRLVVVGAASMGPAPANVTLLSTVSDAQLRWLYANARALTSVSHEDFGLTPVEANAFGTPVLVLRAGGFLDSTDEGVSGVFIEAEDPESIVQGVRSFPENWDRGAIVAHASRFSPEAFGERMRAVVRAAIEG